MSFETELILYLRFALIAFAMKLLRCYINIYGTKAFSLNNAYLLIMCRNIYKTTLNDKCV